MNAVALENVRTQVSELMKNKQAAEAVELIKKQTVKVQADILLNEDILGVLAHLGQAQAAIGFIKAQPLPMQKKLLASFNTVFWLAKNGQARTIIQLIKNQKMLVDQEEILVAPLAVCSLAMFGEGLEVLKLIGAQPEPAQERILADRLAKKALGEAGHQSALWDVYSKWESFKKANLPRQKAPNYLRRSRAFG